MNDEDVDLIQTDVDLIQTDVDLTPRGVVLHLKDDALGQFLDVVLHHNDVVVGLGEKSDNKQKQQCPVVPSEYLSKLKRYNLVESIVGTEKKKHQLESNLWCCTQHSVILF